MASSSVSKGLECMTGHVDEIETQREVAYVCPSALIQETRPVPWRDHTQ